eukprot:6207680-Pleurochrysis_carterae.AAC.3
MSIGQVRAMPPYMYCWSSRLHAAAGGPCKNSSLQALSTDRSPSSFRASTPCPLSEQVATCSVSKHAATPLVLSVFLRVRLSTAGPAGGLVRQMGRACASVRSRLRRRLRLGVQSALLRRSVRAQALERPRELCRRAALSGRSIGGVCPAAMHLDGMGDLAYGEAASGPNSVCLFVNVYWREKEGENQMDRGREERDEGGDEAQLFIFCD